MMKKVKPSKIFFGVGLTSLNKNCRVGGILKLYFITKTGEVKSGEFEIKLQEGT